MARQQYQRGAVRTQLREWLGRLTYAGAGIVLTTVISFPQHALGYAQTIETAQRALAFERAAEVAGGMSIATGRVAGARHTSESLAAGDVVRVMATAYSSDVAQTDDSPWVTASGLPPRPDSIAANFVPLGTVVKIGRHTYIVQDRLNARFNDRYMVDVWQPTREDAINFGVRTAEITIISVPQQ